MMTTDPENTPANGDEAMSEERNDGGPAFPAGPFGITKRAEDGSEWHEIDRTPGMSLRDWFAGTAPSAPPGWTSRHRDAGLDDLSIEVIWRWGYADAMLMVREETKQ